MIITLIRFALIAPYGSINNEPTPPIGLAYIASSCKSKGITVKGIDSTSENLNKIFKIPKGKLQGNGIEINEIINLIDHKTKVFGISLMFSHEWSYIKDCLKVLKKKLQILYKKLKFKNNIFVHRDFHVSNLMKINNQIGVIDSQDAIIGNPTYDLASLIDDVRIKTSNQLKNNVLNYYLNKCPQIYRRKKNDFIHDFNILSVQRNLKIIGIFSRLFKRDKKKQYLKLIPYTWKLLELRLKDKKVFGEINTILNQFISSKTRKKIKFYAN